jgi:hypothetical protein
MTNDFALGDKAAVRARPAKLDTGSAEAIKPAQIA